MPQTTMTKAEVPPGEEGGKTGEGIRALFESYIAAFDAKDIDRVMAAFADAPNTVMMGTGPDEIWLGKENIRAAHMAFMASGKKATSEKTIVSLGANDNVEWASGFILMTQKLENRDNSYQLNLSMVFERTEGKWYITAMHFSNLTGPAVS